MIEGKHTIYQRRWHMELAQSHKPYHSNHSIVYSCQYHVIFCPKYRRSVLRPPLDTRLKELILEKQEAYGYAVLGMEVMLDHVHLLLDGKPANRHREDCRADQRVYGPSAASRVSLVQEALAIVVDQVEVCVLGRRRHSGCRAAL